MMGIIMTITISVKILQELLYKIEMLVAEIKKT